MSYYNFIIAFSCYILQHATATWRLTPAKLPYHHYFERSVVQQYFVAAGNTWIATDLRGNRVTWLLPSSCFVYSSNATTQTFSCTKIGNYSFGINVAACSNCLDNYEALNLIIVESTSCYYWYATEFIEGSFVRFEIMVSSEKATITDDRSATAALTDIFFSRSEYPVLMFERLSLRNVSYRYDQSAKKWIAILPKQDIFSPFLTISATHDITVFGCKIAPTTIFSKYVKKLGKFFDYVDRSTANYLRGSESIIGKVTYHPCFAERSLLATSNRVFFTLDDFATVIALRASPVFPGFVVSDIKNSISHIFLLISGKLFAAPVDDFQNFREISLDLADVEILGLQAFPLCLRNRLRQRYLSWKSAYIVAWSSTRLYLINEVLNPDINNPSNWRVLELPRVYSAYSIKKARIGANSNIWIRVFRNTLFQLLECSFMSTLLLSCSELTLQQNFLREVADWNFIKSAHSSVLVWSNSSIRFSYDQDQREGFFNQIQSIKQVIFDAGHSLWLVQTLDNLLYYGSGETTQPTLLRRVDLENSTDFAYKFREIDQEVIRISWNVNHVTTEIYPLSKELYSVAQRSGSDLCNYGFISSNYDELGGNVVHLDAINATILISYTIYQPPNLELDFSFSSNFMDLVTLINTTSFFSILKLRGKPPLTVRTYQTFLTGTCEVNGPLCNRGVAVFETRILPSDGRATCLVPKSEVLYVNVTCEDGLHIRIRSDVFEEEKSVNASYWPPAIAGCTYGDDAETDPPRRVAACYYTLSYPYNFYPIVEMYSFDRFVGAIEDDVRLVEINNRTGFELGDINLIRKECFLCSNFENRSSQSELTLQRAESVCPCKLDKYPARRWISTVNLDGVGEPRDVNERNLIRFRVKVLGKSYCDLTTFLTILVLPIPKVSMLSWQVNIIWGFVAFTLLLLIISYWTYRREILKMKKQA